MSPAARAKPSSEAATSARDESGSTTRTRVCARLSPSAAQAIPTWASSGRHAASRQQDQRREHEDRQDGDHGEEGVPRPVGEHLPHERHEQEGRDERVDHGGDAGHQVDEGQDQPSEGARAQAVGEEHDPERQGQGEEQGGERGEEGPDDHGQDAVAPLVGAPRPGPQRRVRPEDRAGRHRQEHEDAQHGGGREDRGGGQQALGAPLGEPETPQGRGSGT